MKKKKEQNQSPESQTSTYSPLSVPAGKINQVIGVIENRHAPFVRRVQAIYNEPAWGYTRRLGEALLGQNPVKQFKKSQ